MFALCLREVLVNGKERPLDVELGVSRFTNVKGFGHDTPEVTFHSIRAYKINSMPIEKRRKIYNEIRESGKRDKILHYGLMINHNKPIESITLKYSYFGIPMQITQDIEGF